jgi:hypothetical protein
MEGSCIEYEFWLRMNNVYGKWYLIGRQEWNEVIVFEFVSYVSCTHVVYIGEIELSLHLNRISFKTYFFMAIKRQTLSFPFVSAAAMNHYLNFCLTAHRTARI